MNAPLALRPSPDAALYKPSDLALIRRAMAKGATDDEFSIFVQMCRALRLDPLRKQVYCFIFSPDDEKKRQMTLVTSIAGLRTIAARSGDYRPDSEAPVFHLTAWKADREAAIAAMRAEASKEKDLTVRKAWLYDQTLALDELYPIDPTNPEGIDKVVVRVFRFSHGDWHAVTAEACWSEFAPIKDEWAWNDEAGKRRPTGRRTLDGSGQWVKMPRTMLAKCAESAALRRAWPDDLSNVYVEEEVDRQKYIDLAPNEMADLGAQQARLERVQNKDCLMISWTGAANEAPEEVPYGSFPDRAFAFIASATPQAVEDWSIRNRHSLKVFWTARKTDALEIKRRIEKATEGAVAA